MGKAVALVTGAGGEMGHRLTPELVAQGFDVIAVDLVDLPPAISDHCIETVKASIAETKRMRELIDRHRPAYVFHLAAILSAKAERDPILAHEVNVQGTLDLMRMCASHHDPQRTGASPVRFVFPSSIAIYGLPDAATKNAAGALREEQWTLPTGMYGCNKLYCELIGGFMSRPQASGGGEIDFRSIRFPGLISSDTLPTSGTTDYAPAMIHAAVQDQSYTCFVAEDARLPFMTMPDAVDALLRLALADRDQLSNCVYNIQGFSATAAEIRDEVLSHYPEARIDFKVEAPRQALVDTWPAAIDDSRARHDWGLAPKHDLKSALSDYLVPDLRRRYSVTR